MRKTFLVVACAVSFAASAVTVSAGGVAAPVMEPGVIVQETTSAAYGWVVPVLVVALLVAVLSGTGGGGVAVSDARLKTDIARVGTTAHGLPLYQFSYVGQPGVYEGVMAEDVARVMPAAVVALDRGYMAVDYDMLGLKMRKVR